MSIGRRVKSQNGNLDSVTEKMSQLFESQIVNSQSMKDKTEQQ